MSAGNGADAAWHVPAGRPRILISPAEAGRLAARRAADPDGFQAVARTANLTVWNSWDEVGLVCIAKSLLYRTDGTAYAKYRQEAADFLAGTPGRQFTDAKLTPYRPDGSPAVVPNSYGPGGDPNLARPRLFWAALAYDFVADWLSSEQRERATRWILAQAAECQSGGGEAGELDNYFYRAMSAVGIAGMALLSAEPDRARSLIDWSEQRWQRYRQALAWPSSQGGKRAEGAGGFLPEGTYYSLNGWYIPFYLLGVQNCLGQSRWEGLPHYADRMVLMLMEYHPGAIGWNRLGPMDMSRPARNPIAVGDTNRNVHGYQLYRRWEEALLARAYTASPDATRRRRAAWLNWWLSLPPVERAFEPTYRVIEYLFRDPSAPREKPSVLAWNTGLGHVFLRSKWGTASRPDEPPTAAANAADEGATQIYYHAGPLLTGHEHLDQGSFQIWKRGDLAIDSGIYDDDVLSDHMRNWSKRTVAHNSLLIVQPGEKWTQAFTGGSSGDVNDGGQRSKRPTGWGINLAERKSVPQRFDTARIRHFENTATYAYIDSDITQAYNTVRFTSEGNQSKVNRVTRQLIYLRPEEGARGEEYVILWDRVESRAREYRKKWLLHFLGTNGRQSEPELLRESAGGPLAGKGSPEWVPAKGEVVTPETETIYRDAAAVRCDAPDRKGGTRITAGDGPGRLVLETLLPVQRTIRKIGRFPWIDGLTRHSAGTLDIDQVRLMRANQVTANASGARFRIGGVWTVRFTGPRQIVIEGPAPGPGEAQVRTTTTLEGFDAAGVAYAFDLPASAWSGTFRAGDRFQFTIRPGKATWVEDPDRPSDSHEPLNTHEPKYGEWRVEVEPPPGNPTDYFLNVLYPTVNSDSRIPTARVVGTSDGSMLGARVPGRLVLFGRDGPAKAAFDYQAGGLKNPTRHLLVDLRPGAAYQVKVNNGGPTTITATSAGVLQFETRAAEVTVRVKQRNAQRATHNAGEVAQRLNASRQVLRQRVEHETAALSDATPRWKHLAVGPGIGRCALRVARCAGAKRR